MLVVQTEVKKPNTRRRRREQATIRNNMIQMFSERQTASKRSNFTCTAEVHKFRETSVKRYNYSNILRSLPVHNRARLQ